MNLDCVFGIVTPCGGPRIKCGQRSPSPVSTLDVTTVPARILCQIDGWQDHRTDTDGSVWRRKTSMKAGSSVRDRSY